jgi:hypothetical protein
VIDAWGIQSRWEDAAGVQRDVDAATIHAMRELVGRPDASQPGPLVVAAGTRAHAGPAILLLEDGSEVGVTDTLPPDVPIGYHSLRSRGGAERPSDRPSRPLPRQASDRAAGGSRSSSTPRARARAGGWATSPTSGASRAGRATSSAGASCS